MDSKNVAIAITVFRNPPRLASLLDNMKWAGLPDIPIYVFQDPSPKDDERFELTEQYLNVCLDKGVDKFATAPHWGCMQGSIQFAFEQTTEDWLIYVPDDVVFTKGALLNEYAGVLAYGRKFVGGIQAPYWNAVDLVQMGCMPYRDIMFTGWHPEGIPQNAHWNGMYVPRRYINLNGAGFSLSRRLWKDMKGFPKCTWRLDEYAGYMAWKLGYVILTLPGQPRIHYFGATTPDQPEGMNYHTVEAWKQATGLTPEECGIETTRIMNKIPDDSWNGILDFFEKGGRLV